MIQAKSFRVNNLKSEVYLTELNQFPALYLSTLMLNSSSKIVQELKIHALIVGTT